MRCGASSLEGETRGNPIESKTFLSSPANNGPKDITDEELRRAHPHGWSASSAFFVNLGPQSNKKHAIFGPVEVPYRK